MWLVALHVLKETADFVLSCFRYEAVAEAALRSVHPTLFRYNVNVFFPF